MPLGGSAVARTKRVLNCVVLSCLNRPGVIWRFFRRIYFYRLGKKIEALPRTVLAMGRRYDA